jgi:hypothetical protein
MLTELNNKAKKEKKNGQLSMRVLDETSDIGSEL